MKAMNAVTKTVSKVSAIAKADRAELTVLVEDRQADTNQAGANQTGTAQANTGQISTNQSSIAVDQDRCRRLCQMAFQMALEKMLSDCTVLQELVTKASGARIPGSKIEISVTFLGRAEMAELNREHMGSEGPTDVLAFPLLLGETLVLGETLGEMLGETPREATDALPKDHPHVLLGDIAVCPSVAQDNANQGNVVQDKPAEHDRIEAEIDTLIVHGLLHLLGMDHAEDGEAKAMFSHQAALLDAFWKCE